MELQEVIPILRIFDENKAREFYLDYLEFKLDWEHRFEDNSPLYMQISKDNIKVHLSEHYGEYSPGAAVRIKVDGIIQLHQKLLANDYHYSRPGLERTPWGNTECCVIDPFGNKIYLYEDQRNGKQKQPTHPNTWNAVNTETLSERSAKMDGGDSNVNQDC